MVKPSPVTTGPMQAEVFRNLEAGSESPRCGGDLKVGDRVSFVRWVASQGSRETEVIVRLITKAYIYCDDLQTGEVHVFNRWNCEVTGLGKLEPVSATEPLLLQGYSYAPGALSDVLEAEARQGRVVAVVIQHRGGYAVGGWEKMLGGQDDSHGTDS